MMMNAHTWESFAATALWAFTDRYGPPTIEREGEARWTLPGPGGRPLLLTLTRRAGSPDGFAHLRPADGRGELARPIHDAESLRCWFALLRGAAADIPG